MTQNLYYSVVNHVSKRMAFCFTCFEMTPFEHRCFSH